MHITDSQLTLGSAYALEKTATRTATLERIRGPGEDPSFSSLIDQELNRLLAAREGPDDQNRQIVCCNPTDQIHDMVETLLNMLFGPTVAAGPANQPLTPAADAATAHDPAGPMTGSPRLLRVITTTEQLSETESCQFAASGKVCLADGSERQFDVGFSLERSEEVTRISSRTLSDPLVIDSDAPRTALADASIDFDLNSDGKQERMRLPGAGSALLFLDINHNGRADNGNELFGPQSGNGFAELARLDSDRNGWIDSADAAFADLMLWQAGGGENQQTRSLGEAGIGALATASVDTPFELKENGQRVGQMRSSSVWLGEAGGAGVIRQIDIGTTPANDEKS